MDKDLSPFIVAIFGSMKPNSFLYCVLFGMFIIPFLAVLPPPPPPPPQKKKKKKIQSPLRYRYFLNPNKAVLWQIKRPCGMNKITCSLKRSNATCHNSYSSVRVTHPIAACPNSSELWSTKLQSRYFWFVRKVATLMWQWDIGLPSWWQMIFWKCCSSVFCRLSIQHLCVN